MVFILALEYRKRGTEREKVRERHTEREEERACVCVREREADRQTDRQTVSQAEETCLILWCQCHGSWFS